MVVHNIVAENHREGLIPDKFFGAKHRVAEALGFTLTHRENIGHVRDVLHHFEFGVFPLDFQIKFQLRHLVKMVDDDLFVAPGDDENVLNPRCHNFLNDILNGRFVHNGQNFLRYRFGHRQKTRAETGSGNDSFFNFHGFLLIY